MCDTADCDMQFAAGTGADWNMLFGCGVCCVGVQQCHRFAAADQFTFTIKNEFNQVSTNFAKIKFPYQIHISYLLPIAMPAITGEAVPVLTGETI
jgi:hypothetical protein